MNLVLDDAEEVNVKKKSRKTLGKDKLLNFFFYLSVTYAFSNDAIVLIREDPS